MILELTQQNILNLTNESKRKNILAAWRSWGIWHKAPEIGLSVYRLGLPDNGRVCGVDVVGTVLVVGVNGPEFCDVPAFMRVVQHD